MRFVVDSDGIGLCEGRFHRRDILTAITKDVTPWIQCIEVEGAH